MNKLDSYSVDREMMKKAKNKGRRLGIEQDIEAALQLIQLKHHQIHEPFRELVQKSKELLEAQYMKHNKKDSCNGGYETIRKRKSDGVASCSSSITFDLEEDSDGDGIEAFGSVKRSKKFRSIVDIYNVTRPL